MREAGSFAKVERKPKHARSPVPPTWLRRLFPPEMEPFISPWTTRLGCCSSLCVFNVDSGFHSALHQALFSLVSRNLVSGRERPSEWANPNVRNATLFLSGGLRGNRSSLLFTALLWSAGPSGRLEVGAPRYPCGSHSGETRQNAAQDVPSMVRQGD